MKNLNIISVEKDGVRFWGFDRLGRFFTPHFTLHGLVLKRVPQGTPGALEIKEHVCKEPGFCKDMAETGFKYGTMVQVSDTSYIGLIEPLFEYTLEELTEEFYEREDERNAGLWS